MDFSELFKQTLCKLSPNGKFVANCVQFRLIIRDADTLQILHLFTCIDNIAEICWSLDSELISCCSYKLGSIQIWKLSDPDWTCKIEQGISGLKRCLFAPDRSLITLSDYNLRACIWNLVDKSMVSISYPKWHDKGLCFRRDNRYMLLVQRKDCKDSIAIYDCLDWTLVKHFEPETMDLEQIEWSPCGRFIAIKESILIYKVLIYYPDGRLIGSFTQDSVLGIKQMKWSPSGQFLLITDHHSSVKLLNHYTWNALIEFDHSVNLIEPELITFKEKDNEMDVVNLDWEYAMEEYKYVKLKGPIQVPILKSNHQLGCSLLSFSPNGRWLVTRNDNMPRCLWIWDLLLLKQQFLIIQQPTSQISKLKWNPQNCEIFCFNCKVTNTSKAMLESKVTEVDHTLDKGAQGILYLWNGNEMETFQVNAANFEVCDFEWNVDGKSILLKDKDKFIVGYKL